MTPLIKLHRVSIDYPIHQVRFSKAKDGFTQKLGGRLFVRDGRQYVRALDRVTLRAGQGTRIGLIGANGSGKSTLLRTMAGILPIASGVRLLEGKMVTLFSTTAGMDMARTGAENIWRLSAIHNVPASDVPEMIEDIAEFTELGRFLHMPVKTYSAGMRARLGFAIATSIKSDIVLIDEVIGAGDSSFYEKARGRLDAFMSGSGIVVVASHSMAILKALCNKGVVVKKGKIVYEGSITAAAKFYTDAYGTAVVDEANVD